MNYLLSLNEFNKHRQCKKCLKQLDGKFKVGVFKDRQWNLYHPQCYFPIPPSQMDGYNSLSEEDQFEVDNIYFLRYIKD